MPPQEYVHKPRRVFHNNVSNIAWLPSTETHPDFEHCLTQTQWHPCRVLSHSARIRRAVLLFEELYQNQSFYLQKWIQTWNKKIFSQNLDDQKYARCFRTRSIRLWHIDLKNRIQ